MVSDPSAMPSLAFVLRGPAYWRQNKDLLNELGAFQLRDIVPNEWSATINYDAFFRWGVGEGVLRLLELRVAVEDVPSFQHVEQSQSQ